MTAELMHAASGDCSDDQLVEFVNTHGPLKQSKRGKRKLKKTKQREESDFVQQVEVRFEALNCLVMEGSITQEILVQLRRIAIAEANAVDEQACDLLII